MKIFFKVLIVIIAIGGIAGYIYWQMNKKKIIKDAIENKVGDKSDSLYYIHYDSSSIDEINGNAAFYHVYLQSDSMQKEMLKRTDSLPAALFNIRVDEVAASGVDIPGLLQNQYVGARKILLTNPIIQIINTGSDKPKAYTQNDTLELYKKILGRFKSIKADTIQVINGTLLITDRQGKPQTTFEKINVTLKKFIVDSTHDYENIISYFIKDVKLTVENIQSPESDNDTRINIGKLDYDAAGRSLKVYEIQQYRTNNSNALIDIKNIRVSQLNTDAFILHQQLKAGMIECEGGLVTIYKKPADKKSKKKTGNIEIGFSSPMIEQAQIDNIQLGNTKIIVIDPKQPAAEPFVLNNVTFNATKLANVTEGSTINDLIQDAEWQLGIEGFSLVTKDKWYRIAANGMLLDNKKADIFIKELQVKPLLTEAQYVKQSPHQQDLYDFNFYDVSLKGVDFKALIANNELNVTNASLHPVLKILNDRTLPVDTNSKVGKYPHQQIAKIPFPVYIKVVRINNAFISYREKAKKSGMIGDVFFKDINGTIENITNIKSKININPTCRVAAKALFLGKANISTEWLLPLNNGDTTFTAKGQLVIPDLTVLNQIIEPLGMASMKSGKIKNLQFSLTGTDYKAIGDETLLYNDLKVEVLKKNNEDELKTKEVATILANIIVKNNNPQDGELRTNKIDYDREINKSFFNFLWKSIYSGAKKTVMGKKD